MAFHNRDKKDFNAGILYIMPRRIFRAVGAKLSDGNSGPDGPCLFPDCSGLGCWPRWA